jgi:hypothetical protein
MIEAVREGIHIHLFINQGCARRLHSFVVVPLIHSGQGNCFNTLQLLS